MKGYPYFIPLFYYPETMPIKPTKSGVKTDKAPITTPQVYLKEIKESIYSLACSIVNNLFCQWQKRLF